MPKLQIGRHASALKEVRKTIRRNITNTYIKSKLKTAIKKFERLIQSNDKNNIALIKTHLSYTFSQLDKATKKNVIHSNKAANQKKRLSHLLIKTLNNYTE
ncbi:MAG: 30S ribosomal protein S20 [Endomicrobium sp.]|jgi:small subunit ribosomal protein S20|nr:30S ribosomal protein S20 [Endomicrobium sp.]